eukprot:4846555-Pleurochrysis_carterae.AAC.2
MARVESMTLMRKELSRPAMDCKSQSQYDVQTRALALHDSSTSISERSRVDAFERSTETKAMDGPTHRGRRARARA